MQHDLDRDTSLQLLQTIVNTADQTPLKPHVAAMTTEGFKDARA